MVAGRVHLVPYSEVAIVDMRRRPVQLPQASQVTDPCRHVTARGTTYGEIMVEILELRWVRRTTDADNINQVSRRVGGVARAEHR